MLRGRRTLGFTVRAVGYLPVMPPVRALTHRPVWRLEDRYGQLASGSCPVCGQLVLFDLREVEQFQGRGVRCPGCDALCQVPDPEPFLLLRPTKDTPVRDPEAIQYRAVLGP